MCAVGGACILSVCLLQKLSSHASDKVSELVRGREGRGGDSGRVEGSGGCEGTVGRMGRGG